MYSPWPIRYVAPLLARIAGYPEYFDHPFERQVLHPHDRDAYRATLRRLLTGGTDAEQAYRVQAADGSIRWVRYGLQVMRDASGRPTPAPTAA